MLHVARWPWVGQSWAKCYRHPRGGRKNLWKSMIRPKYPSFICVELEHWIGLNGAGEEEDDICRIAPSWTSPHTCYMSSLFSSHPSLWQGYHCPHSTHEDIKGERVVVPNPSSSQWEEGQDPHKPFLRWEGWAWGPVRLPSMCEDHTTDLLPGRWPGQGIEFSFWEVVIHLVPLTT